ncbi:hypothetical protein MYX65_06675 [Acidobacteria bacterium AH-259-L09]|nr:hypothetical protein [Acidobacteria bacterium AH-259-L09]
MAWETRQRGGRYYTQSRKVGGRVIREYVGAGPVGELAAAADARARAQRQAQEAAWRAEFQRIESASVPLEEFCGAVESLARVSLLLAGYHRHHRGEWRRKRGK